VWRLSLTEKAGPVVKRLGLLAEDMASEAFGGLSAEEIETTREMLARVRENIGRLETAQKVSA
jgi:DNA-binding MarR family transcriptional regulator